MISKYKTLINVLDILRKEAPESYKSYYPLEKDIEKLNQARSKAYIHLYLQVKFGLLDFEEREQFILDGKNDGGIDGYFIDKENRVVYFIQSKFRTNQKNFESREIKYKELLNMDVDRILDGETKYENGVKYNSKVQKLISDLQNTSLVKYRYEVILLANTKEISKGNIRKLIGSLPATQFDFNRTYNELLFPIVTGTFYSQSELIIEINLGNKNSEDISYSVDTEFTDCEISALFVPTIEIAKCLYKYKNSILKYNPRSYLDMASGSVNSQIAKTILTKKTNEFALFNNGITMLSDDTRLNKQIAKKETGQLIVTNPQIINGGQTAYTLSRIYEDVLNGKNSESVFENKEVLLKVITFSNNDDEKSTNDKGKLKLIEAISKATNQQTQVSEADRRSNDEIQVELQSLIFNEYGLFYQRKAGEYGEGVRKKYINRKQIIDRELLLRLILATDGKPSQARRSGAKTLFKKRNFDNTLNDASRFKEFVFAYQLLDELNRIQFKFKDDKENKDGIINYGHSLRYGKYAVIAVIMNNYSKVKDKDITKTVSGVIEKWLEFEDQIISKKVNSNYFREVEDFETGTKRQILNYDGYYKGRTVNKQLKEFVFFS